jgi:hypothetical protein
MIKWIIKVKLEKGGREEKGTGKTKQRLTVVTARLNLLRLAKAHQSSLPGAS